MPIYTGHGSALGLAEETTWGTPVARTNWLTMLSCSLERSIEYVPRANLGRKAATSWMRRAHYTSTDNVEGDFEWEVAYDDSSIMLLKHLLWGMATTGAGPTYTHTATISATAPTGLTVEKILGDGNGEVFEGVLIAEGSLRIAAGGIMTGRVRLIGETGGGLVTAGTPTYSANGNLVKHDHAGVFAFNSQNYDLLDMEVTLRRALDRRLLLGSKLTKKPIASSWTEVTARLTTEYDRTNPHSDYSANTQGDGTITFTDATRSMAFTLQNMYTTRLTKTLSSPGVIRESWDVVCESDGTDEGLKIATVNGNSSATAN